METERSASQFLPPHRDLESLREVARECRGCDLFRDATQTVFGDGSPTARVMLVGEQPRVSPVAYTGALPAGVERQQRGKESHEY